MISSSIFLRDYAKWELNAFLWISLITITVLLLKKVFKLFTLWFQAKSIPGPPCSSFYGHTHLLSGRSFTEVLSRLHEKYGSVVKVWLGPTKLLVSVKEPVLIKEMLLKAEDKLPLTGRAFSLAFGQSSLFASSFDKVQNRRESLALELNERFLERENVIPTRVVDSVMDRIHGILGKASSDCKMVSQHMAFTMLGATIFGDAFLAWPKATVYEELLMTIAKDACFWASYSVTPFWKRGFWRYQHLCSRLKCLTQDIVQQCQKNCKLFCHLDQSSHNETSNTRMETALGGMSCSDIPLLDNLFSQELNGNLNVGEEPCGNLMGVMFHGYLTTTGLIVNILARLAIHQEIQDKIFEEIIMARKGSVKQEQQCVGKMLLLLATVYESARLLPAGALLQRCSLKHDLTLKNGVTIPTGAMLVVPVQLVQTDKRSWGSDSSQFNPYRFLSEIGKQPDKLCNTSLTGAAKEDMDLRNTSFILKDPNDNAAFLPFGSGSRACVGQKFVIHGVATLFASLLESYEIRLQPGSEKNPKPIMNSCVYQLLPSVDIIFVRRNA
ncbi:cytochrome P450 72A397-like [Mangifera indica]|uniref:cytochrome P450 72A397-like n=1 Tax=Mangifera indica TaxID=29780 RepID=UPI001CF9406A|nr:cytochrome P450 72A397-like [Mangifera indica]